MSVKFLNISCFFLLAAALVSCSSRENNAKMEAPMDMEEAIGSAAKDTIKYDFKKEEGSDKFNVEIYERRAGEKIEDLAGYIEILSHKNLDPAMREGTAAQTLTLFTDTTVTIEGFFNTNSPLSINNFIDSVMYSGFDSLHIQINHIAETLPLRAENDSVYKGSLHASHQVIGFNKGEKKIIFNGSQTIQVVLRRTEKKFGNETQTVWELNLGNIFTNKETN